MKIKNSQYFKNVRIWYLMILYIVYMVICFFIPSMMNSNSQKEIAISGEKIDFNEESKKNTSGKMIHLLLTANHQVVEMPLDEYLKGVLLGEVPITYEMEALKAQAVVARTYTIYKLKYAPSKHEYGADMCDNIQCCQAYKTKEYAFASWDDEEENQKWAKLEEAIQSTEGEVIYYQNELINAFFHAHSGGTTENVKYLWAKNEIPYLVSVPGNEGYIYQDSKTFTKEQMKELLQEDIPFSNNEITFEIKDYTGSGRVNHIAVNGTTMEGTTFREKTGIKSTNFRIEESGDAITIYTVGYGHGIGMSQEGANQMATEGKNYIEIIQHYYTGVDVKKWIE